MASDSECELLFSLAEENAKLRALVHRQTGSLPLSPPATEKSLSEPSSPILRASDSDSTLIFAPVQDEPKPLSTLNLGLSALSFDKDAQMQALVELFKEQLAAQAAVQDQLLSQLGELRCSHANLQATTADVTDELTILRDKATILESEVEIERARREAAEAEKIAEAEKVSTLRQKMEESRRAIMRMQEEAASKRSNDSRRSSLTGTSTGPPDPRRASVTALGRRVSLHSGLESAAVRAAPENRRSSLGGLALSLDTARKSSMDVSRRSSGTSEASIGLGLEGVIVDPITPVSNRRASTIGFSHRVRPSFSATEEDGRPAGLKAMLLSNEKAGHGSAIDDEASPSPCALPVRRHSRKTSLATITIDEEGSKSGSASRSSRSGYRASVDQASSRPLTMRPHGRASMPDIHLDSKGDQSEVALLKAQLAAAQHKLAEAQEAKAASDTCLSALKEYIALPKTSPSLSGSALKLPPLPTDDIEDDEEEVPTVSASRRVSMWRLPGFVSSAAVVEEPKTPSRLAPPRAQSLAEPARLAQETSPQLTAFSGWSVRRRASAVATKEKPRSVSPIQAMPDINLPSTFGNFSFQSRARNPALEGSPASPGGGLSPGGTKFGEGQAM